MDKQTKKNIGFTILTLAVLLVVSAVLAVGGLMQIGRASCRERV